MGNPNFLPPPESMSLEISTPKNAQVITLPTLTRVQNFVMIAPPDFPPRMGENANPNSSFPSLSFPFLPYFILAHVWSLNALTDFNAQWLKYVDWRKEVPFVCSN